MTDTTTCFDAGDMADNASKAFRECEERRIRLERELDRANGFHERLAEQRDELLAVLKNIDEFGFAMGMTECKRLAYNAIAKHELVTNLHRLNDTSTTKEQ